MDGQTQTQTTSWVQRLQGLWGGLKMIQRVAIIAGLLTMVGIALVASLWTQTPDYATLFSGLSEEDAAAVVDQLKTLGVTYRLAQNGTLIQVPARDVYDVRLEMAKQGLPKGSTVGFELFDSSSLNSLGMTDFLQKVNYQRALEGELARTIDSLDPVASSRVHIVIPEQTLFKSQESETTASIVLQLKPNKELTKQQVQAINHLVASSVENLKPSNITIVDMMGNVLAAAGQEGQSATDLQSSNDQLETQRNYERDLERRLQAMLDQALGANHAIVRVHATLDWDQKKVDSETYTSPGDGTGVVRSEQIQEESTNGTTTKAGGIPGVDTNTGVPGYPTAGATASPSGYSKKNTTRNYELSKVVQTVTKAPGSVQRLAVAVLLDDSLAQDVSAQVQAMVSAGAGLDTSRGDTVAVQRLTFADQAGAAQTAAAAQTERNQQIFDLAKLGVLALVLLILLRFVWVVFRDLSRRLAPDRPAYVKVLPEDEEAAPVAAALPPAQPAVAQLPAPAAVAELPEPELPFDLPSEPGGTPMQRHLADLANRRPDLVADLVQSWLVEN